MFHLDFWGSLIDLIGLVILLSYDVPFLQGVLMGLPSLKKRHSTLLDLKTRSAPTSNLAEWFQTLNMMTLNGAEVAPFMALFPDRDRSIRTPQSVFVLAYFANRLRNPEPWIFPSSDASGTPQLASAISLPVLFTSEENDIRKSVYTIGFILMFVGSLMYLIQAASR